MRTLFLCIILFNSSFILAQNFNYKAKWETIYNRYNKNKDFKSIQPLVEEIKIQANKENNVPQYLKSIQFIGILKYRTQEDKINEDVLSLFVNNLLYEEKKATGIQKVLMHYIVQDNLTKLLLNNSQNIRDITPLENTPENITEWSTKDYKNEIIRRYEQITSIPEVSGLKGIHYPKKFKEK